MEDFYFQSRDHYALRPLSSSVSFPLRLCELVKLQSSCKKLNLLSELMDHSGDYIHTALPFILSLLQQGLSQRIHLLTHSLSPDPKVKKTCIQELLLYFILSKLPMCRKNWL